MPEELPERFNLAAHFLDEPAKRHPNRAAIAGEPDEVTYGELAALANRVGNGQGSNQEERRCLPGGNGRRNT